MKILKYLWVISIMFFFNIYDGIALDIDNTRTTFYVDCAKTASGSGSSWKDALNTTSFVQTLSLVNHPCTFYLAEGVYDVLPVMPKNCSYSVSGGVTIRGGYSTSSGKQIPGALSVLVGDASCKDVFIAKIPANDAIQVYDVHFKLASSATSPQNLSLTSLGESSSFHFERCVFSDFVNVTSHNCSGNFVDCDFSFQSNCSLNVTGENSREAFVLNSCSFSGRNCLNFNANNILRIYNCVFAGVDGTPVKNDIISITMIEPWDDLNGGDSYLVSLKNNTILGNVFIKNVNTVFTDNFVHGLLQRESGYEQFSSSSNMYVVDSYSYNTSNLDREVAVSHLPYFFKYKFGTYELSPVKGKPTKTIELLRDHIMDESNPAIKQILSFRSLFSRLVTDNGIFIYQPLVDQRGVERYFMSCFGAFEIPFVQRKNYFVKTDGSGDGSSWDKAMGLMEFYYYFFYAPNHSTFHFAEGHYYLENYSFANTSSFSSPCFYSRQLINLIGGYPKNPRSNDRPNPYYFQTLFDAVYRYGVNDDSSETGKSEKEEVEEADMKLFPEDGASKYEQYYCNDNNIGSNLNSVFYFDRLNAEGDMLVSGLLFANQYNPRKNFRPVTLSVYSSFDSGINLKIDKCTFFHCENALRCENVNLELKESYFENIRNEAVYHTLVDNNSLRIESCTFYGCNTAVYSHCKNINVYNSTFVANNLSLSISPSSAVNDGRTCSIECNTILDPINVSMMSPSKTNFIGNILMDQFNVSSDFQSTENNLFVLKNHPTMYKQWPSSSDKFIDWEDLLSLMDCSMAWRRAMYLPKLEFEAGRASCVPVVSLLKNKLLDGKSLLFPLNGVSVKKDQRGVSRNAMTCVGACEYGNFDEVKIPTAFTPYSRNGKNDVFMKGHEVYIYNRYGILLCHSQDGWDGSYKDETVEPGVYVYVVVTSSDTYKGTVEVVKSK